MADESKGKGKSRSSERSDNDGKQSGSSSAAQSLASALRTTMASSQLSSVLSSASGGKEGFQVGENGGGGELRDWLVQDMRSGGTGSSSGAGRVAGGGGVFRTQAGRMDEGESEGLFEEFERGLNINRPGGAEGAGGVGEGMQEHWERSQQRWQETGLDPSTAHPLGSYTDLDGPLHASVRRAYPVAPNTFGPASQNSTQVPASQAPLAQTDDVFALLDAEQSTSHPPTPASPPNPLSSTVLANFDPHYRPPSPSHPSFSREQAALHLTLAEEQQSSHSRQDLLIPRPDNAALHEGAYASTAEQALESIFNSSGRSESSSVQNKSDTDRGTEVVRKITTYFAATKYIDDVYGLPPVLRETIETVETEQDGGEKRDRAVRRLEKLWQHLSNVPPTEDRGAAWVDGWLANNT